MRNLEVRVQGIVVLEGRILLARHAKRGARYWVLPGGHREPGETLEEALTRELDEELGIRPAGISLFSVSEVLLGRREILDVAFRVLGFHGSPRLGKPAAELPDRRLDTIALHDRATFETLEFRPAALGSRIASAGSRDDWSPAGYLGNLAVRLAGGRAG